MMTKIFVIDDHPLLRLGITQLINHEEDMVVCGEAANPANAVESIKNSRPDVILLDLSLQGASGIDLLHELKTHFPHLKVLILSMHDESVFAERAMSGGASGYIIKQEATEKVLPAIRAVCAGKTYVTADIAVRLRHRLGNEPVEPPAFSNRNRRLSFKELHAA